MLENRSVARRSGSLDHIEPIASGGAISLRALRPEARFVLRIPMDDAQQLGVVAGFDLNCPINRFSTDGGRIAARLGPDEWLLVAPEVDHEAVHAALTLALGQKHHALVDIGHRNAGLLLCGAGAAAVISAGCPLDLGGARFEPGSATRTLLGKAEIVLFRLKDSQGDSDPAGPVYRIECWRSFARYVTAFLTEAMNAI